MTRTRNLLSIGLAAAIVCLLASLRWTASIRTAHQRTVADELLELEEEYKQQVASRSREHRNELERAWGDAFAVSVKDPELTIEGMIQRAAESLVPQFRPRVCIDDFTAFDLTLHVPKDFDHGTIKLFLERAIPFLSRYLESVTFVTENRIRGVIDKFEIDHFTDWIQDESRFIAVIDGNWRGGQRTGVRVPEDRTPARSATSGIK